MSPQKKTSSGTFITLEGGEGSGKTSVMTALALHLKKQGHDVLTTREPGATDLGSRLRQLILHEKKLHITAKAELFLFLADRAQHVETVILPALEKGCTVLCDRFTDSTIAYQGAARKLDGEFIHTLCSFTTDTLSPDLTLFLHLDPVLGLKRANRPEGYDRLETETLNFHQRVLSGFEAIAKANPQRVFSIDATASLEKVIEHAKMAVDEHNHRRRPS